METLSASGTKCKDVNGEEYKGYMPREEVVPEDFKTIQNTIIYKTMYLLPLMITLFIILILIMKFLNILDNIILGWLPIIISAYIACAVCLSTFCVFMNKLPETFRELWRREIVVVPNSSPNNMNNKYSKVTSSTNILLEDKFRQFINDLQIRLNHRNQWLLGIYVLVLTILWNYPLTKLLPWTEHLNSLTRWNQANWQIFIGKNWHLFNELPVLVIATFIGIMIWKMYVTSKYTNKLMNEFHIEPKLGHPDTAGGLSPLGNLYLLSFIITNVPFVHLSGWLLLGTLNKFNSPLPEISDYYIYAFSLLLIGLFLFPFVTCFVIPVWHVHRQMIEWRNSKQGRLCQIGYRINELEFRLLNEGEKLDLKEFESAQTELEEWKKVYTRNEKLPTWPFNVGTMWKLLISYIIPALSLISIAFLSSIGIDNSIDVNSLISYTPILGVIFQLIPLMKINNKT